MNKSNLRVLINDETDTRAPNNVLRGCVNVFEKVIVAGYTVNEGDINIYACANISEADMALIAVKLQATANAGWIKEEECGDVND